MERCGMKDVPHQSLIGCTHHVCDFLVPVYDKLKKEVKSATVLHADETTWKMLEGDPKRNWQMWGFFTKGTSFHVACDTRASQVSIDFLKDAKAKYLVTDAYRGYEKSTKGTKIKNAFCNAHARREFIKAEKNYPDESEKNYSLV